MTEVEPIWKQPKRPSPGQRAKRLRELRTALFERASFTCEFPMCEDACQVMHHRFTRAKGGSDELTNLMALCQRHHGLIHDNPTASYAIGWLLRAEPVPCAKCDVIGPDDWMHSHDNGDRYCPDCCGCDL